MSAPSNFQIFVARVLGLVVVIAVAVALLVLFVYAFLAALVIVPLVFILLFLFRKRIRTVWVVHPGQPDPRRDGGQGPVIDHDPRDLPEDRP